MAWDFDVPTQIEALHSDLFCCSFFFATPKARAHSHHIQLWKDCHMLTLPCIWTYHQNNKLRSAAVEQNSKSHNSQRMTVTACLHVLHPASNLSSRILVDSPNDNHPQFFLYQGIWELNLPSLAPPTYYKVSCSNFNWVSVVFQVNSSHQPTINVYMTASWWADKTP
jgi:hypothetical protein